MSGFCRQRRFTSALLIATALLVAILLAGCSGGGVTETAVPARTPTGVSVIAVTTACVSHSKNCGGADEVRTRDLLRDRQLNTLYLVGLSSFLLRHSTRFWT